MTVAELRRQIKLKNLLPVYFFYGEEDFLIDREVRNLVEAALDGGDASFNYHVFWGSEQSAGEIIAAAKEFPFLSKRRVVLVRDCNKLLDDKAIQSYVDQPANETVLILVANNTPSNRRKRSATKKKSFNTDVMTQLQSISNKWHIDVTLEFKPMREPALLKWIVEEFHLQGKNISQQAATILIQMKGSSTREIAGEIEKICTALNTVNEIGSDHIVTFLGESKQYNLFELSAKILARERSTAMDIIAKITLYESPTAIVAHLSKQLMTVWLMRAHQIKNRATDEDARKVGLIWGWQYEDLKKILPNFRNETYFESCFINLLEADLELKSKPTSPATVLTRLVHQLTTYYR